MDKRSPEQQELSGVPTPYFLYGTAWKEDETQRLTELAIQQGFRGMDTANQRKHYYEAAVGQAIVAAIKNGVVKREELFLQTKFTFQDGQDHRLPYDPHAPISIQVEQSLASSLNHLNVEWIDSYLLHSPTQRIGLAAADWAAWEAMENLHDSGRVRMLGISNITHEQLKLLCQNARIQPSFVQNRCYAIRGWDREVRRFCAAKNIVYQGFSLLTANRNVLAHPGLAQIAVQYGRTVAQVIFRFALDVGMLPLTGTTDVHHMQADLALSTFHLDPSDINRIETIAML